MNVRIRGWLAWLGLGLMAGVVGRAAAPGLELPAWVDTVGARQSPTGERIFRVTDFGAQPDGATRATAGIQAAIDAAHAAGGGVVTFAPGTYVSGALFVKSGVHLRIDAGVTLQGVADEAAYPRLPTRVAGIEMEWPAALLNVYEQENVKISGAGTIDGNGEWCWRKYWTLRKDEYDPRGLRWAADYDAERVRLFVAWRSRDVTLEGLTLRRSGFWTVQLTYCDRVTVDGIHIRDNAGPSTDGVDIDSSSHVLVQRCDIDNNDDDICLKAGRDADGLRVNRPTEYVVIRDNIARRGDGVIGFGSETAGGIRHVVAYRNRGIGTNEGLRFKSARTRGGYVRDVLILDTTLENVVRPVTFTLNWNPGYSYVTLPTDTSNLPAGLKGRMPAYWQVMAERVPPERGIADFGDITIARVKITGARQVFTASGMAERPLHDIRLEDIEAAGQKAGTIAHARDWTVRRVRVVTPDGAPVTLREVTAVDAPVVTKGEPGMGAPAPVKTPPAR